jgi:hypothetical protein
MRAILNLYLMHFTWPYRTSNSTMYFFQHTGLTILPDTLHLDPSYTCPAGCTSVNTKRKLRFYLRWSVGVQAYDQTVFAPELCVTNTVLTQSTPNFSVEVILIYSFSLIKYYPKTINLHCTHIVLPYSTTNLVKYMTLFPKIYKLWEVYQNNSTIYSWGVCLHMCARLSTHPKTEALQNILNMLGV